MRRPVLRAGWLHDEWCFGCGQANPVGLRLTPSVHDDGSATADVVLPADAGRRDRDRGAHHSHLAVLAVPLDCVASWVAMHAVRARARQHGRDPDDVVALTGSFTVRFDGSAAAGERLRLRGERRGGDGCRVDVQAVARASDDAVVATFHGVFVEAPLPVPDDDAR